MKRRLRPIGSVLPGDAASLESSRGDAVPSARAAASSPWAALRRPLAVALIGVGLLVGCSESPESLVGSAKEFLAKDDLNAAAIQLKNALQKDGSLAEARFLLGTIYLDQGDINGAVKELRRAGELGYPAAKVSPPLSRALLLSSEFDQILKEFDGVRLDDPAAQALVLAVVGDAYLAKGNLDKARTSYEAAVQANPADPLARAGLGRTKLFAGDPEGALADADAALAMKSDVAEAHVLRADILLARGQAPEAIAALEAAIKARPRAVSYHFSLISLLLRENDLTRAAERLEAMKKLAPRHPSTRYLQAFMDFRNNRLTEARDILAEIIKLSPDNLPARLLAGTVHLRLNDHPVAQQHLAMVVARAPRQPFARRLLALSLNASGDSARAKEVLEPLLDSPEIDAPTMMLAGQIYLANGDFDRASAYFEKAAVATPDDARARARLGVSRLAAGDEGRAFADLEAAAALDSSAGEADVALILAHLRRGEFNKAMAAQAQLERKQPDNPQTFNLKGGILIAMKDIAGARAAFEKALSLKPDFLSAAINLARLDLAEDRPDDARKRIEAIIAADPKNVGAQLVLADLLARSGGKPSEIQAVLERAAAAGPSTIAPKLALVRHYLNVKESKKALALAQDVAAANPSDSQAVGMLARAQSAAGDHQQAISSFNRLAGLQPRLAGPLVELSDAQRMVKDRAGAEQALNRALKLQPDLLEAQQRLISLMIEGKRTEDALKMARTIQKQRPDAPAGFVLEGDVLASTEKWDQAVPVFRKAHEKAKMAETAVKLHAAQTRAGKAADAKKLATEWLRGQPEDLVMRGYLAERALAEQRLDDAEQLYRKMIEIRADNPLVLNNLAWVVGQRKSAEGIALAERALALAPDNPAILDTLGMLQVESGERDKGLANLRRAVTLAPDVTALRLNLAKAYSKLQLKEDARRELDTLLGQVPPESRLHAEASALRQAL